MLVYYAMISPFVFGASILSEFPLILQDQFPINNIDMYIKGKVSVTTKT